GVQPARTCLADSPEPDGPRVFRRSVQQSGLSAARSRPRTRVSRARAPVYARSVRRADLRIRAVAETAAHHTRRRGSRIGRRPGDLVTGPRPTLERIVAATTHGRYLVATADAPALFLVGFHGYAEAAELQMERMRAISGAEKWTLLAVQGLHRFYLGRRNDVV